MILKKVLRVNTVKRAKILSELAHVNQVQQREVEQLGHLNSFLDEYTVEKKLEGRPLTKSELLNQDKFVGTIVGARQMQHEKINKISQIRVNKQQEFAQINVFTDTLEAKIKEKLALEQSQREIKEDSENTELFNVRKLNDQSR